MINKKSQEISLNNYQTLLTKIKKSIEEAGKNIAKTATREKVVMAWQIGKLIDENLQGDERAQYGQKLFEQLEADVSIKQRALYKIHNFYKSYPTLPQDDEKLNWSHYRALAEIKNDEKRKYLENLAIEGSWGSIKLAEEIKNVKKAQSKKKKPKENPKIKTKLTPVRGQLFSYPLVKIEGLSETYIDCGFNIFQETTSKIEAGKTAVSSKGKDGYSFKEIDVQGKKLNIYKAYLQRVVDGDTLRVTLDLGFKILHKEILRLKGVDAPEMGTKAGQKSYEFLNNLLQDVSFLVIKTVKIDIYGRYVADVFFDASNKITDAQDMANNGTYLNQLLLDEGTVQILNM